MPPQAAAVFDRYRDALAARDPVALYDVAPDEVHAFFERLYARLNRAREALPRFYEGAALRQMRAALGLEAVGDARDAKGLFVALADLSALPAAGAIREGLTPRQVRRDGSGLVVTTASGDVVHLVHETGRWAIASIGEVVLHHPTVLALARNVDRVLANVEAMRRHVDGLRDPRQPAGAVGLFRNAVQRRDGEALLGLLDADSRALLEALWKRARAGGGPSMAAPTRGADVVDALRGADGLPAAALAVLQLDVACAALPCSSSDRVDSVETLHDGGVLVHTTSGKAVALVRAADGTWRLAGLAAVLRMAGARLPKAR